MRESRNFTKGRYRIGLILLAIVTAATPAAIAAKDKSPAPIVSAEDAALIARAEARGRLMYAYDKAAWIGTDDLQVKLPDFKTKVGGWIVDGPAEAPVLVFFDRTGTKAVYVAQFRDNKMVSSKVLGPGDDATLSPARLKMIDARTRALAAASGAKLGFCANGSPNSIVLPPETPGGPYLVYFMTPQVNANSLPFGGHYLFEVAQDGTVSGPRRFTRSCIELSTALPKKVVALVISHLLDPVPTEIHVFSQLAAKVSVMVVVENPTRRLYMIKDGKIAREADDSLKGF